MKTPLQTLQEAHPSFKFKNRTNVPTLLRLQDNDSIHVMAGATVTVESSKILQMPDPAILKTIVPSYEELVASGYYVSPEPVAPVKKSEKE